MSIEAMKQALEALENAWLDASMGKGDVSRHTAAITSLRQAIAEAEKEQALQKLHDENERLGLYQGVYEQEPVRLQCTTCGTVYADGVPPQRQWVGLTDDEKEMLSYAAEGNTWQAVELAEAKLKEKNT